MKRDLVILLHGFNVFDGGRKTVGRLAPFYDPVKFEVEVMNYGYFGLLSTRYLNDNVAEKLAGKVRKALAQGRQVHLVGHSNGCTIIHLASHLDEPLGQVTTTTFINPALRRDAILPAGLGKVYVYYAPSDLPVKLAKFLFVPAKFRPWGEMGAYGVSVPKEGVMNINMDVRMTELTHWHTGFYEEWELGHSGVFQHEFALRLIGAEIANRAKYVPVYPRRSDS